jgi:hypothetical protein
MAPVSLRRALLSLVPLAALGACSVIGNPPTAADIQGLSLSGVCDPGEDVMAVPSNRSSEKV